MNTDLRSHRVFLFADTEVLSNADAFFVKCVEADYEATDYVPKFVRSRGGLMDEQYYFGWMPMKVAEVVALWKELECNELEDLAPHKIEGCSLVSPEIWESVAF